jgi:hypothetical protein
MQLSTQHAGSAGLVAGSKQVPPTTMPTSIAGHGDRSVATIAADPLEINAILFTFGNRRCLFVSFDLLYIGGVLQRRLRAELIDRHGFADEDVFLFASHTHFAPPTDPDLPGLGACDSTYSESVRRAALELVGELLRKEPVSFRIELRRGRLSHAVNRRRPRILPSYTRTSGFSLARVSFAPYPEGERDDTATMVSFTSLATGAPLALMWHYACHPVAHTPSQVTSADFPGMARQHLRQTLADPTPVLFLQGFCGDIRPNIAPERLRGWRERLLSQARNVIAGTPHMSYSEHAWQDWVSSLACGVGRVAAQPPVLVDEHMDFVTASAAVPLSNLFDGKLRVPTMLVRGIRLGRKLQILAFGAEPTTGWQQQLESEIDAADGLRLYAGYCGDVFGYLPLPTQVSEGGYEVSNFQKSFGMQGRFRKEALLPNVVGATKSVASALEIKSAS